jgi:hypothetical protein
MSTGTFNIELSNGAFFELNIWENFPADLSLIYFERCKSRSYETDVPISIDQAVELIEMLKTFVKSSEKYKSGEIDV